MWRNLIRQEKSSSERVTRDALVKRINALRSALQDAADRTFIGEEKPSFSHQPAPVSSGAGFFW